jgi:hypothetical protein
MNFELKTISTRRFLLIILFGVILTILLSAGLAILTGKAEWVMLIFAGLLITFILAHKLARQLTFIGLDNTEYFSINSEKINFRDIRGYFLNESGMTQSSLGIRLQTGRTIHLAGSKTGKDGRIFKEMLQNLISRIKLQNPESLELAYQDVYVKQGIALRWMVIVLAILVGFLDLFAIFLLVSGQPGLPWQIFLLNAILIGLVPYIRKRK